MVDLILIAFVIFVFWLGFKAGNKFTNIGLFLKASKSYISNLFKDIL